jgi:hypothetical protein
MRQILAVIIGLALSGMIAGIAVPRVPTSLRRPWLVWAIAALTIGACLYVAERTKNTPPE